MNGHETTSTIRVFNNGPEWDSLTGPWFTLGVNLLQSLHVASYTVVDCGGCEYGDCNCATPEEQIESVKALHPGCVYVY